MGTIFKLDLPYLVFLFLSPSALFSDISASLIYRSSQGLKHRSSYLIYDFKLNNLLVIHKSVYWRDPDDF